LLAERSGKAPAVDRDLSGRVGQGLASERADLAERQVDGARDVGLVVGGGRQDVHDEQVRGAGPPEELLAGGRRDSGRGLRERNVHRQRLAGRVVCRWYTRSEAGRTRRGLPSGGAGGWECGAAT